MARRKRQSTAEGVLELVARWPWWVGVILAVVTHAVFRWLAGRPQPTMADPRQVADVLPHLLISGVSSALQFVVPLLCVIGAALSAIQRRKRAALVTTVTGSRSADALNGMSWAEFELLVGEAFRVQGYQVKEQGGARPDGGVDLVLRQGDETFLVQCKQWKAMKVGVDVVRELYGVMAAQGAAGGFVVTSGRFTADAVDFAAGRNLQLVDGSRLFGMLQQARAAASAHGKAMAPASPGWAGSAGVTESPACPKCSATMVQRTANKGANAGAKFWGCSKFPACYGTRSQ
jgi:restriction system protein